MPLRRLNSVVPAAGNYMPLGSFQSIVTILAPGGRNNDGSTQPSSPLTTSWAAIRALRGDEVDKAQQIAQSISHMVVIPYQTGITNSMSVGLDDGGSTDRIFQINYVEDADERQVELRLYCTETGQNAGQQS
jgi:SPP1 family predicted phage head-tail adaptor